MVVYESGMTEPMIRRLESFLSEDEEFDAVFPGESVAFDSQLAKQFMAMFLAGLKSFRGVDPTS